MSLPRALGSFERAMVRTQRHAPFNVVVALRFTTAPTTTALERALAELTARHAVLGGRVGAVDGRPALVPGAPAIALERLTIEDEAGWRERIAGELARPIDLDRGPLLAATLVTLAGTAQPTGLLLTFPHLLIDATSGAALVDELLARCSRMGAVADGAGQATGDAGEGVPTRGSETEPAPTMPILEARFPARHRGLGGRLRAFAALGRQLGAEAAFVLAARGRPRLAVRAGRSIARERELDRATTGRLLAVLRRRRLTLNSALATAWALAWSDLRYGARGGPVRTFTMAGLRRLVDPPIADEALGAGWAMMRTTIGIPATPVNPPTGEAAAPRSASTARLLDLAAAVQQQLARNLARGDAYTSCQTAAPMMGIVLGPMPQRMGELAVSYTGVTRVARRHGDVELADLRVYVASMDVGPAVVAHAAIWDGALRSGLVAWDPDVDGATADRLAHDVHELLTAVAGAESRP